MAHRISIPSPCQESWEKMSPTENGRFCAVCAHEVPDLTRSTDAELMGLIHRDAFPACARLLPGQLDRALGSQRMDLSLLAMAAAMTIAPVASAQDTSALVDPQPLDTVHVDQKPDGQRKKRRKPFKLRVEPIVIDHIILGDVAILPPPRTLIGFTVFEPYTPPECGPMTGVVFIPPADQQPAVFWEKDTYERTANLNAGPRPAEPPSPQPERAAGHAWAAVLFDRRVRIQAWAGFRKRLRTLLPL